MCTQYYLFNDRYPLWFGEGDDPATVAVKVVFDQLVLTPLLCLCRKASLSGPAKQILRLIVDRAQDLDADVALAPGPDTHPTAIT